MSEDRRRINTALEFAMSYGQIDGDHHKAWVIDQLVRILASDDYDHFVDEAKSGGEYDWDVGVAP